MFYRHQDRLGSSDALTNAGGEVATEAHGYDAFGRPRGREWQATSDNLHPGGDYGAITGSASRSMITLTTPTSST